MTTGDFELGDFEFGDFEFGLDSFVPISVDESGRELGGDVVHIPLCMGAVVPAYAVPSESS